MYELSPRRSDRGETLLEVVLALTFISIAVVTLIVGLGTSATLTSSHRSLTGSDVELKTSAEAVKNIGYTPGAAAALTAYTSAVNALPQAASLSRQVISVGCLPNGVTQVSYTTSAATQCTTANDTGLQIISIRVFTSDNKVNESTTVLKRASS